MTDIKTRRMYLFLIILAGAGAVSFQGWRNLLNNFAVEIAHIDGAQMGIIQSVREIPGFFALLAIYLLFFMREHRLAAAGITFLGVGVALSGVFPDFWGIVTTTLLMSFGFHYYETMNQSLILQYFNEQKAPLVLGRLRSLTALANIITGALVWLLSPFLEYTALFALLGIVAVLAGLWGLCIDPSNPDLPMQRKQILLRKKYWLFYVLTFLAGARRQFFVAFAIFLLVSRFGYSITQITMLFVLNNAVNFWVNPLIGRAVNRFGERRVLSLEYLVLIGVFAGYALTSSALFAGVLYVVNNIFYNFALGIGTFFQKIADPADISSGMATGFTINHVAAVCLPALGGMLWLVDPALVFWCAAGFSTCSLILVQYLDHELDLAKTRKAAQGVSS